MKIGIFASQRAMYNPTIESTEYMNMKGKHCTWYLELDNYSYTSDDRVLLYRLLLGPECNFTRGFRTECRWWLLGWFLLVVSAWFVCLFVVQLSVWLPDFALPKLHSILAQFKLRKYRHSGGGAHCSDFTAEMSYNYWMLQMVRVEKSVELRIFSGKYVSSPNNKELMPQKETTDQMTTSRSIIVNR